MVRLSFASGRDGIPKISSRVSRHDNGCLFVHKNSNTRLQARLLVIIGFEFFISLAIDSLTFSSSFTRWNSASVPTLQCFFHNENAHVDNRHSYVIARLVYVRKSLPGSFSAASIDAKLLNVESRKYSFYSAPCDCDIIGDGEATVITKSWRDLRQRLKSSFATYV